MGAGTFFKRLAAAMKDNPAYPADGTRLWMLRQIGVRPGEDFDISAIDPAIARGLDRAVKDVLVKMNEASPNCRT
jgi:hypothetical protein